jgi:hypothetical protein
MGQSNKWIERIFESCIEDVFGKKHIIISRSPARISISVENFIKLFGEDIENKKNKTDDAVAKAIIKKDKGYADFIKKHFGMED